MDWHAAALLLSKTAGTAAKITYHLAPPLLSWIKDKDGHPRKLRFSGWITILLRGLGAMRWVRGQWYDPFGYGRHNQQERQHRDDVICWLQQLANLSHPIAADQLDTLLDVMLSIRGYGYVRDKNYKTARPQIDRQINAIMMTSPSVSNAAQ